jgi:hypothetical protein
LSEIIKNKVESMSLEKATSNMLTDLHGDAAEGVHAQIFQFDQIALVSM